MKALYQGTIVHDRSTFRRLVAAKANCFSRGVKTARLAFFVACIFCAVAVSLPSIAMTLLLMVGCWGLAGYGFAEKKLTDELVRLADGRFPRTDYSFFSDRFVYHTDEVQDEIPYASLLLLAEDRQFFYLFTSRNSGFMLSRASLGAQSDAFRVFLAQKTGRNWKKTNLLSISLNDLLQRIKRP